MPECVSKFILTGIISVKTIGATEERGIDSGNNKRTQATYCSWFTEHLLAVIVHAANTHDAKPGILITELATEKYPSIQRFCAGASYLEDI